MEHAIEEPGKHLAALQNFIGFEVPVILKESSSPATVTTVIDERAYRVRQEIYKGHLVYADAHAHTRYLASRQLTLLDLVDQLLEYTQPIHLYSTLAHRTVADEICQHLYRALESLLDYTVILASGQIDPGLPMPPAVCALFQQLLGSDLGALRGRLAELHVSQGLIDIALLPFEKLWRENNVTFHTAVYLRELKQKLQALAGGEQRSPGDGDMLALLVKQNFNEPAFVDYYYQVIEGQLETITSPEARLHGLHDHKSRLARLSYNTRIAWHADQPSVRQQLMEGLDGAIAAQMIPIPATLSTTYTSDPGDYEIPDGPQAAHALMLHMHPAVFGALANAAHERGHIYLGERDKQRAGLLASIRSSISRLATETIRRAFNEAEACRKAVAYLQDLIEYLKLKIEKLEK
jgi:hypothetical protein